MPIGGLFVAGAPPEVNKPIRLSFTHLVSCPVVVSSVDRLADAETGTGFTLTRETVRHRFVPLCCCDFVPVAHLLRMTDPTSVDSHLTARAACGRVGWSPGIGALGGGSHCWLSGKLTTVSSPSGAVVGRTLWFTNQVSK